MLEKKLEQKGFTVKRTFGDEFDNCNMTILIKTQNLQVKYTVRNVRKFTKF